MAMANLPARTTESAPSKGQEELHENIVDLLEKGLKPAAIAAKLAPDDKARRKRIRAKVWKLIYTDVDFQNRLAMRARGHMLVDLLPTVQALGERAKRGRPDAAKIILEASGFHNPRVQHQHTGEIKISMDLPRPKFDEPVVDADVVE